MTRLLKATALVTLLVGCGGRAAEDQWDETIAEVSCKTLRRCDPISFNRDYLDLGECEEATVTGDFRGCVYDRQAARRCIRAFEWSCDRLGRDYDEWRERCDAVWDCSGAPRLDSDTGATTVPPL